MSIWEHESVTDEPVASARYFQLEHIGQLPELLEKINSDQSLPASR